MLVFVFLMQMLWAFPITNAYATQVKDDVIVNVTYTRSTPTSVCVSIHAVDDDELTKPLDQHCWHPEAGRMSDWDVWERRRLDDDNFRVTVTYADAPAVVLFLRTRTNT